RDLVRTGEGSVARVLLGGKALVTVRELSALTITEEAGRAVIDVESGKLALAVARERLRPGERIEIRTPNAVAGVRGTVVIVEVIGGAAAPAGAAAATAAAAVTRVHVLRGLVDVVARGVAGAAAVNVGPLHSLTVTVTAAGPVRPMDASAVGAAVHGLKTAPPHKDAPESTRSEVSASQVTTAVDLLNALFPEGEVPATPADDPRLLLRPEDVRTQMRPTVVTAPPPSDNDTLTLSGPPTTVLLAPETLQTFSGTVNRTVTDARVRLESHDVVQTGDAAALFLVAPDARVAMASPILTASGDSGLSTTGRLLDVQGSFTGTASRLFGLDTTALDIGGELAYVGP
ncbi:MAG TPA: FecR domain-containing protein, partial [Methylomirabilota bacterium]|nr:FecR domain-containing protein [Methylomirabilota bacterium]